MTNFGKRRILMFDIALTFLSQLVDLIVPLIALYILFDFVGMLLFGRR